MYRGRLGWGRHTVRAVVGCDEDDVFEGGEVRAIVGSLRRVAEVETSAVDPEEDCAAAFGGWCRGDVDVEVEAVFALLGGWVVEEV